VAQAPLPTNPLDPLLRHPLLSSPSSFTTAPLLAQPIINPADTEPKIVNGPEVLSKFVGQSEENVRALFAEARAEEEEKGDDSSLHVIIFDEIDALCKQRGTTSGDAGVLYKPLARSLKRPAP